MYIILETRPLAPDITLLRIEAPRIARKRQAGQFVILRVHERGERIPITIADSDPERGDITIVVQGVGKTTKLLNSLRAGDALSDAQLRAASALVHVTTDDGTCGERGLVTDRLRTLIEGGEGVDYVLAIGPIPMMRAVAELTRPHRIRTVVSLNSIMMDGTGMGGGCRVIVDGRSRFACVDGPEFDAHLVDFDVLDHRNAMYRRAEAQALRPFP